MVGKIKCIVRETGRRREWEDSLERGRVEG